MIYIIIAILLLLFLIFQMNVNDGFILEPGTVTHVASDHPGAHLFGRVDGNPDEHYYVTY